jgi:hypothetical protein
MRTLLTKATIAVSAAIVVGVSTAGVHSRSAAPQQRPLRSSSPSIWKD